MKIDGLILAIESSTRTGSVAIGNSRELLAEVTGNVRGRHSASLVPAADTAIKMAGVTPPELAAIVVGGGPGSFTGLRIATATAKGIAHALGLPLYAFGSLLVLAAPFLATGARVCSLIDARGRDVFAGFHDPGKAELEPPAAMELDEAIERCRVHEVSIVTGDAALRHEAELRSALDVEIGAAHLSLPRASSMLWLAGHDDDLGELVDLDSWEPNYLRASGAERIRARNAEVAGESMP